LADGRAAVDRRSVSSYAYHSKTSNLLLRDMLLHHARKSDAADANDRSWCTSAGQ